MTWRRAVLPLVALSAVLPGPVAGAREPRAPASPEAIVRYRDSGEWTRDISAVTRRARKFLARRLERRRPRRPAIVLDIDDTSLSNYACFKAENFSDEASALCAVGGRLPAIPQTRSLFRFARKRRVAVFFITGRPESQRAATERNLRTAGYEGWTQVVMVPNGDHFATAAAYKAPVRAGIARDGYTIIANVGDQPSDLEGGGAEQGFLLPNPFYRIP